MQRLFQLFHNKLYFRACMTQPFEFKELDEEGLDTLDVVAEAENFNRWMYDQIKGHCQGRILEIGSGIGNISRFFLEDKKELVVSDLRKNYREALQQELSSYATLGGVLDLDIVDPAFDQKFAQLLGTFDTVFALNVVEHIEDDTLAIKNCMKLLKKGGKLIILVPAYQALYNQFDKELYHYRRYTKTTLNQLFKANGLPLIESKYFNALGILGWYVSGKLQKNKTIPKGQMKLYNLIIPISKVLDAITFKQLGLSVISVGQK